MSPSSQFSLLRSRRFLPFFLTQALGAFNDNLFKQAIILAILFKLTLSGSADTLVNLCALLFVLPFFLFSAFGGQLGEKYAKDWLIRRLKLLELALMLLGALAFWLGSVPLMLLALFAMGTQSALFGPVKYSILPQHLDDTELVGGNALVESGTFLAILLGTLGAGLLLARADYSLWIGASLVVVALLGYLASRGIPAAPAALPGLRFDWNIPRQTWRTLRMGLTRRPAVSRSLLGNSWFWLLGAVYLTQIPALARDWLHGDESVATLILLVFSVGIALGSMLCERLSGHKVEIGLVPFGSLGLSLFGLLLAWHVASFPGGAPHDWLTLLASAPGRAILLDILGLGVFGGFYIVPLYALIQSRSEPDERARVIAANNILNALFMVLAALLAIAVLDWAGLGIPELFLIVSLLNLAVNGYIFTIVPEFSMRFIIWLLGHTLYRVEHRNLGRRAAGVQPRVVRRRAAARRRHPSPGALRHVLPHLQPAGAQLRVPHRRRGAHRRPARGSRDLRAGLRAHQGLPGGRRSGVHLPGGQADHHRRAERVQGRRRADPARHAGAGDPAGAARAVGQLLQPRPGAPAVPPHLVAGHPGGRRTAGAGHRPADPAAAGRRTARCGAMT